jgi:tripartite-type tricarboxylate transporter receptor subunit TctC
MTHGEKQPFKSSKVQAFKFLGLLFVLTLELLNPLNLEQTFAQANFYQGKTIRIVVGLTPGGFYDRWARLLARFMPLYIPGNPSFIVQNMAGAGSMIAMNHIYGVAKADGLTLGMPNYGVYLDQLAGRKEVRFDVTKMYYIGSPEKSDIVLYARADAPFKTLQDMRRLPEPPKCGASGTASAPRSTSRSLPACMLPRPKWTGWS